MSNEREDPDSPTNGDDFSDEWVEDEWVEDEWAEDESFEGEEAAGLDDAAPEEPPLPAERDDDGRRDTFGTRFPARFAQGVLVLALATALLGVAAGFGSRWGIWHFRTGFSLLRWAVYGAIVAALLSAGALYLNRPGRGRPGGIGRGLLPAIAALLLSLVVLWIPVQHRQMAGDAPPIHDITTDTDNPPEFVAVAPLRAGAPNPVEYEGEEVARLQRAAYPDIRPLILDLSAERAFERALAAAERQGWEIVARDPSRLTIEATARTFWFGFRDDVVIRLTPLGTRTVVDVRSKSRIGRGDMGANARRIQEYMREMGR